MNSAITLLSGQVRQWGERTMPLLHRHAYAFSIDLRFALVPESLGRVRNQLHVSLQNKQSDGKATGPDVGYTFHVRDEVLVKTVDDVVRDVPSGIVNRSNTWLYVDDTGGGSLEGRALLYADADARVSVDYSGVVSLPGTMINALGKSNGASSNETGSAFASFRSQSETPKYRWLMENQLFAFGKVELLSPPPGNTALREMHFSYDVYSMGG